MFRLYILNIEYPVAQRLPQILGISFQQTMARGTATRLQDSKGTFLVTAFVAGN